MASNDWKANPNGEAYLKRIREIGRPGIKGRLQNELAPAIEQAIEEAFRKQTSDKVRRLGETGNIGQLGIPMKVIGAPG